MTWPTTRGKGRLTAERAFAYDRELDLSPVPEAIFTEVLWLLQR